MENRIIKKYLQNKVIIYLILLFILFFCLSLSCLVNTEITLSSNSTVQHSQPCFDINEIEIQNAQILPNSLLLKPFTRIESKQCFAIDDIKTLVATIQNQLIAYGWITTRVQVPEQDITKGKLKLFILAGIIRDIRYSGDSHSNALLYSTMPLQKGKILYLPDIEQGLDNLQYLPMVTTAIEIVPADHVGESDIIIQRKQKRFWHINLWVNNSGKDIIGKYQSGLQVSLDNPTTLSNLFAVTAIQDLSFSKNKGLKNYSFYYTIPFRYWKLGLEANTYQDIKTVVTPNSRYQYKNKEKIINGKLNYIFHRNSTSKTTLNYAINLRENRNYFGNIHLTTQKRRNCHWKVDLNHSHYLGSSVLDAGISYQRGVKWFGAQSAPEENNPKDHPDYATSLTNIFQIFTTLNIPLVLYEQYFQYQTEYLQQYTRSPLTFQDQFSIGDNKTVRGFDGEDSIKANNGWYIRNTLFWLTPINEQQLYLGLDYGRINIDKNKKYNSVRNYLMGSAIGLQGNINPINLSYDVSISTPILKPKKFQSSTINFSFNVVWNY